MENELKEPPPLTTAELTDVVQKLIDAVVQAEENIIALESRIQAIENRQSEADAAMKSSLEELHARMEPILTLVRERIAGLPRQKPHGMN